MTYISDVFLRTLMYVLIDEGTLSGFLHNSYTARRAGTVKLPGLSL